MKKKVVPFVENIGEATAACLITMVQGNVLALGLTHWIIASQTGLVAGAATSVALLLSRTSNRWIIAAVLGITTAIVDYFMHHGMLNPPYLEAVVTGIGAAILSLVVGAILQRWRARKAASQADS